MPGLRAILVDLDGTLIDSQAAQERVWTAWARRNGYKPGPFARTLGLSHVAKFQAFAPAVDPWREREWVVAQELQDLSGITALPGAREVLTGPWPVAIVTAATHRLAVARLDAAGLPASAVMVTADDVRQGKPDPEPYLKAAELLRSTPAKCDVLEDAPAGVAAGIAARMTVYGVTTTATVAQLVGAHHFIRDVKEYLDTYRR